MDGDRFQAGSGPITIRVVCDRELFAEDICFHKIQYRSISNELSVVSLKRVRKCFIHKFDCKMIYFTELVGYCVRSSAHGFVDSDLPGGI
jgi:hypothetical protein